MQVDQFTATLAKADFNVGAINDEGFVPRTYFFYVHTRTGDSLPFNIGFTVNHDHVCDPHVQFLPFPYYDQGHHIHPDDVIRDWSLIEAFLSALKAERKASGVDLLTLIEGVVPIIKFEHPYYR